MKKIIYLFFSAVIATTTFTACSSSSSDNDANNGGADGITASIIGTWEPVKHTVFSNGQVIETPYAHNCATKRNYVIYKANGAFTDYEHTETCDVLIEEGTWVINADDLQITMDVPEYGKHYKIVSISSTKMILEVFTFGEEEEEEEEEEDGDANPLMRLELKRI